MLSVEAIDPVESTMMATFQGFETPPMEAVAVAATGMLLKPNTPRSQVGTLVVSLTWTEFLAGLVVQVDPAGWSELRQAVVTVVVTGPMLASTFLSPLEPLYKSAWVVEFTVCDWVTYTCPAAASAAALASFWS